MGYLGTSENVVNNEGLPITYFRVTQFTKSLSKEQ